MGPCSELPTTHCTCTMLLPIRATFFLQHEEPSCIFKATSTALLGQRIQI